MNFASSLTSITPAAVAGVVHPRSVDQQYSAAITAQQVDDAYQDYGLQLEMSAIDEIDAFHQALQPAPKDDPKVTDPKLNRTARVTRERRRAAAKNHQPELSAQGLGKLENGEPICAQGVRLTDAQRTVLHGIKAHNALVTRQRQMPAM